MKEEVLINHVASGIPWEKAVMAYFMDAGAYGVEYGIGHQQQETQGIATHQPHLFQVVEVALLDERWFRVYVRSSSPSMEEACRLVQALDRLVHDQTKLRYAALRDPLTGCLNRRGLDEWFRDRKSRLVSFDFVLAMFDLDHFKALNDTQGHDAGDQLLQRIVRHVQQSMRDYDVVARLGGDEFVLIFEQCSCHIGVKNRLEQVMQGLDLSQEGVTITMGVVCYPAMGDSLAALLAKADELLYRGKGNGRNQMVLWEGVIS